MNIIRLRPRRRRTAPVRPHSNLFSRRPTFPTPPFPFSFFPFLLFFVPIRDTRHEPLFTGPARILEHSRTRGKSLAPATLTVRTGSSTGSRAVSKSDRMFEFFRNKHPRVINKVRDKCMKHQSREISLFIVNVELSGVIYLQPPSYYSRSHFQIFGCKEKAGTMKDG